MPGLEKLLRGIKKYEETLKPQFLQKFKQVGAKPEPKTVMFTCMDTRLLMSQLMQPEVGDNFVVRNAGNFVPHHSQINNKSISTEPAALELGCLSNKVRNVLVCGHSDCKAMHGLLGLRDEVRQNKAGGTPLQLWIKQNGALTIAKYDEWIANGRDKPLAFKGTAKDTQYEAYIDPADKFVEADKLSQINALVQLDNIASQPLLQEKLDAGEVRLNALWFDLHSGDFYMLSRQQKAFVDVTDNYDALISEAS